jgi:hypothetical protein
MSLLTQHKVKVKVVNTASPIPVIDWDKFSGGDLTHSITKVRRSAGAAKEVLTGDSEVDNITIEAFIDPAAHSAFIKQLKDNAKFENTSITVYYIDNAGVQVGQELTWTGCSVAKYTPPPADANGEDAAKLVIEWAVGS